MKKNNVFGILATVLALGLVLAGCATSTGGNGGDEGVPKTIIITGFNLPLEGKGKINVELTGNWDDENTEFTVHARGLAELNGQTLTCQLHEDFGDTPHWTGTGEYGVNIRISPPSDTPEGTEFYRYHNSKLPDENDVRISIKDAETTLEWSSFKYAWTW
jgi:hypothetical protein